MRFFCIVNFFDIIFLGVIGLAAYRGFKKGFIIELFTFLALFAGLYAGIHFSDYMAKILHDDLGVESEYMPSISFTVTFLLIGAMVYFAGKTIEKVVKAVQLSMLNKLGGMAFSIIKAVFFLGAGVMLLQSYDEKGEFIGEETKQGSLLYQPLEKTMKVCMPAFEESTMFVKNALYNKDLLNNND